MIIWWSAKTFELLPEDEHDDWLDCCRFERWKLRIRGVFWNVEEDLEARVCSASSQQEEVMFLMLEMTDSQHESVVAFDTEG